MQNSYLAIEQYYLDNKNIHRGFVELNQKSNLPLCKRLMILGFVTPCIKVIIVITIFVVFTECLVTVFMKITW